ncbi:MAG: hypothetical protein JW829_03610 [Pirellulales bacterium]|nr:hypothetical protein [Pirellulales bacterium]
MPTAMNVLNREFLDARAKILALAATLDRLDRADGSIASDPRYVQLREALPLLCESVPNRAEQVLLHFSLPYQATWRQEYGLE